jgi:hypothetical protein
VSLSTAQVTRLQSRTRAPALRRPQLMARDLMKPGTVRVDRLHAVADQPVADVDTLRLEDALGIRSASNDGKCRATPDG